MRHHLSFIVDDSDWQITSLCETNAEQIAKTHEAYPSLADLPIFAESDQLAESGLLDAVIIGTPHTLHADQIVKFLSCGIHVLVDKPMVTTIADAHRVIKARDESGLVCGVSYQRHGKGQFRWMKEKIDTKAFGNLQFVNSHLGQEWFRLTKGLWRQEMALSGGGQLNDSGSHMVDILLWMTGEEADLVTAFTDHKGSEVDINSAVTVKFKSGAFANLSIIGDAPRWHERHWLWFDDAMVEIDDPVIRVYDSKYQVEIIEEFAEDITPERNFLEAIRGEAEILAPVESGLRTIELTEAAWRSAADGGSAQRP